VQVREFSTKAKSRKKSQSLRLAFLTALLLCMFAGGWLYLNKDVAYAPETSTSIGGPQSDAAPIKAGALKVFNGEQLRILYDTFAYPNTQPISDEAPITGNESADTHMRSLATAKGYKIRSAPVAMVLRDVGSGYLLQERASDPWLALQSAAAKDGISLSLTAAFRSADEQRDIFLQRLKLAGIVVSEVSSGKYDSQINRVLAMTALPGYSRHHTGYTIDVACPSQPAVIFEKSICFKWLSADNYVQAKERGWIPSYPEGTGPQGPDPEAWEYVWVGRDALTD